jgi:hypothetical protein
MLFSELLPDVRPYAIGAPTVTVLTHIRNAAIRFFGESNVWQDELDPVYGTGTKTLFLLGIDQDCDISSLLGVRSRYGQREDAYDVTTYKDGGQISRDGTRDYKAWTLDRETVQLTWPPEAGALVTFTVALKPSNVAQEYPDNLHAHHRLQIAEGAIETLLLMPGVDWTNPALGEFHGKKFQKAIDRESLKAAMGFGQGQTFVKSWG